MSERMDVEDALLDWLVWLQDATEAVKRDKCAREDYIAAHKSKYQEDAARAYDAAKGGA